MKQEKKRKPTGHCFFVAVSGLLVSGFAFAAAGGACDCLPQFPVEQISLAQAGQSLLLKHIAEGDFETAETLLNRSVDPNSSFTRQLQAVLAEYRNTRHRLQEQTRQQIHKLREKIAEAMESARLEPPSQPEKILAWISQIQELDARPEPNMVNPEFLASLTEQVRRNMQNLLSRREYKRAWRSGLRVLLNLDPDNPQLRPFKDDLLEKVAIENHLTPVRCPGQPDPYAKVRAEVLYRALHFLHKHYVSPVNFTALIQAAVRRAGRLGEVLACGRNDFLYSADPNDTGIWSQEVDLMYRECMAKSEPDFEPALCVQWVQRILELNKRTLQLPEGYLVYEMTDAMLSELDPYTEIIWPSESDDFDKQMTGEFAGVGIRITVDEKKLKILEVVPGTPADECGRLQAGDWIKAIDGQPTQSLSLTCAVRQISGPAGSQVVLTIDRDGQEEEVAVQRRKIVLPTLHGTAPTLSQPAKKNGDLSACRIDRDGRIGYLWISSFKPETAESLRKVLQKLEERGLIGLVLDLRSNSGGILESAASVADLFLTDGLIVKSRTRNGNRLELHTRPDQVLQGIPIVVLVDESTASGAEIVAGALANPAHPRAVLVGTRTYGKGTIQEVEPLDPDGSRMKYTRGFYVLSGDREVPNRYQLSKLGREDWGLVPNVEVVLQDHQVEALQKSRQKLQQFYADRETTQDQPLTEDELTLVESLVRNDPQLATGLTILKAQILAAGIPLQNQAVSTSNEDPLNTRP